MLENMQNDLQISINPNVIIKPQNENEKDTDKEKDKDKDIELICPICCKSCPKDQAVYLHQSTTHFHCKPCFKEVILHKITETDINNFRCSISYCCEHIPLSVIKTVFQDEYDQLIKKNATFLVANNPDLIFCPRVNCGSVITRYGKDIVECSSCKFVFHTICLGEYKQGHSCMIEIKHLKKELGKEVYKCPTCKYRLVKDEGCNHMTCPFCKHEWCYICGGKVNYNHYNGLLRCYSQFSYIKMSTFLFLHYLTLLLFPLSEVVICIIFIIFIIKAIIDCCSLDSICLTVFVIISLIFAGIVALPIGYSILVIPLHVLVAIRTIIFTLRAIKMRRLYI